MTGSSSFLNLHKLSPTATQGDSIQKEPYATVNIFLAAFLTHMAVHTYSCACHNSLCVLIAGDILKGMYLLGIHSTKAKD